MGTTLYWKPLRGKDKFHYWMDDTSHILVGSACGMTRSRKTIQTNVGFASDPNDRCKICVREKEKADG